MTMRLLGGKAISTGLMSGILPIADGIFQLPMPFWSLTLTIISGVRVQSGMSLSALLCLGNPMSRIPLSAMTVPRFYRLRQVIAMTEVLFPGIWKLGLFILP